MSGLTQELAAFVAAPTFGEHEADACAVARNGFIDTVATMMAGRVEPVTRIALAHYGASRTPAEAPVPFAGIHLPAPQAACVNATAAHALDYDDVALSAHTSTVLVPAILAEGHLLGRTGRDALRAYVIGYEVWAELFAREPDQYHLKGWHPTGVFGAVGAAAGVAWLHRLNHEQAARALAIAASMSCGLVANFGTMTKPLHAGRAAACAIEAVRLAQLGLTAAPDVFEHHAGYLAALSPAGRADRTSPAQRLGRSLRILETGLSIKGYPVCYSGHRVIDGAIAIAQREDLRADQVRRVHVTLGPAQVSMLRNHRPVTALEAKFSAEFAVASAIAARRVGLAQLCDEFVLRDDMRSLYEKVDIGITERQCPIDPAFSFADRVVIDLVDGRSFDSGDIRFAKGNALLPLSANELESKFSDCVQAGAAAAGLAPDDGAALYGRIATLEQLADLRQLF